MIKKVVQEFREGDLAVEVIVITFFNIPIYRMRKTTTNSIIVRQLTSLKSNKLKIKGFNK